MRVVLLRWFVNTLHPTQCEQRPEEYRSGKEEQPETPTSVGGMGIDFLCANQHERDGEGETAEQVYPRSNQQEFSNHGVVVFSVWDELRVRTAGRPLESGEKLSSPQIMHRWVGAAGGTLHRV